MPTRRSSRPRRIVRLAAPAQRVGRSHPLPVTSTAVQEVARRRRRARARRGAERSALQVWRDVLVVWIVSRFFFFTVGAIGHAAVDQADPLGTYREPAGFLHYWAVWDGAWFARIAQNGYDSAGATAFFPVYPILLRAVSEVGPGLALAGVLVSTAAALVALYFVHGLAGHWFDRRVARASITALAFFPTAFYLNAVYSESVFLALTAGSLWALYVRRDLLLAGAAGYLAAGCRNVGIVLLLPLAWEWLRARRELGWEGLVGLLGPPLGLLAYVLYLWRVTDRPLQFAIAQRETWGRATSNPLATIEHGWEKAGEGLPYLVHPGRVFGTTSANPPFAVSNTLNFAFLVLVLALLVLAFVRLPLPVALFCVPVALGPLLLPGPQVPLIGFPRYALAPFPLFVVLGVVLARSRIVLAGWLALSAAAGVFVTLEFVTWRWVA